MDWITRITNLGAGKSRRSISVHRDLSGSRIAKSDYNSKRNTNRKHNRKHKYLLAVGLFGLLSPSQALGNTVGGVSATAILLLTLQVLLQIRRSRYYKVPISQIHMAEEYNVKDRH